MPDTTSGRRAARDQLRARQRFPVLILGGGVNGAGLFRELALQGVDCVLVDKADFAAGASSKSSRMIHGGLRYLENREFGLVREALFERNRLLENAPHYVGPLKTTVPLFSWFGGLIRSALIFCGLSVRPGTRGLVPVKFGLLFYDLVTRKDRRTPAHYLQSRKEALAESPGLHPGIIGTATYWDAWITQAERLCVELVQDALAANPNCVALNYVRPAGGSGSRVTLLDDVAGETLEIEPQVVVNATGAWVDEANRVFGLDTSFMGGTKGSHLVLDNPQLRRALDGRMVYYQHADGRVCITFPFMDKVIAGSTDIRVDDPETAHCDSDEVDYMLGTLKSVFPELNLSRNDIRFAFCGVRPLPASGSSVTANVSRGHSVRTINPEGDRPYPIYALIGGKWTTFRAFAEQVADRILDDLGSQRQASTVHTAIGGGRDLPTEDPERSRWIERLAAQHELPEEYVAKLAERYGTGAEEVAAAVNETDPRPLDTLPEYRVGEIRHIAQHEFVVHLTDLICRRSVIALLGQADAESLRELAAVLGPTLGWDATRQKEEVDWALEEVRIP